MKQMSRIVLSLALLVPAGAFAKSCTSTGSTTQFCTNTTCNNSSCGAKASCTATSCNNSCNQSTCFNSCTASVCNTSCDNTIGCPTFILKRPTFDNTVIAYGLDYQHQYGRDEFFGGFQVALEYQRSFNAQKLAQGMFGTNVLHFAGSQVPLANQAPNSLLADNFGLPTNFQGSIALKPVISDFNLHFDWFFGFDRWVPGLYMQLDMNYDYQMRQLQSNCDCSLNSTTSTVLFPAGYMNATTSPVYPLLDLQTALGLQGLFGDKTMQTTFGRFDFDTRTKSGVAGLSLNLGYDFLRCNESFLGAFFRVVAPTGSKVEPCYVFDAVVGNGRGWEVGGGISGRWEIMNKNDCQKLTAMLDGYVTSVLKHHALRTFDLASTNTAIARDYTCGTGCNSTCNTSCKTSCGTGCSVASCAASCSTGCSTGCTTGCSMGCTSDTSCTTGCNTCNAQNCLTRYSLLKQYSLTGGVYTYASNLITAADFTTRNVEVRTPVKGDATVRLVYTHGGFDLGFGYNVFGMVREKISSVGTYSSCLATTTGTVFTVKGCQGAGYLNYAVSDDTIIADPTSVALINSANASTAYVSGTCGNACGVVDNGVPLGATTVGGLPVAYNSTAPIAVGTTTLTTIFAAGSGYVAPIESTTPVTLIGNVNELDLCSGTAPRQFTNKGFITLDYTWVDNDWTPYLGMIAEVEGGSRNLDLAQWGIVLRGGVSY